MSDPVLALILIASFFLVITVISYFNTLERGLLLDARVPLFVGALAGVAAHFLPIGHAITVGVLLTLAALYVRLTGRESEPSDGMVLGAMTGAAAAIPLVVL